jgi:hypothetical protein
MVRWWMHSHISFIPSKANESKNFCNFWYKQIFILKIIYFSRHSIKLSQINFAFKNLINNLHLTLLFIYFVHFTRSEIKFWAKYSFYCKEEFQLRIVYASRMIVKSVIKVQASRRQLLNLVTIRTKTHPIPSRVEFIQGLLITEYVWYFCVYRRLCCF